MGRVDIMQNPNEDTEWNDVLRAKGIIPEKPKEAEVNEEDLVRMLEETIREKSGVKRMEDMDLDELDELEDEEEEKILLQMRNQRMAEIKARMEKSKYGDVREITAVDYVQEVNKAGDGVFVILHHQIHQSHLDHLHSQLPRQEPAHHLRLPRGGLEVAD